jgi:predicted DNA-binding protein (MmcQ/YjbR family)
MAYPGVHSKAPWPGHDDLAVKDKTFAYLPVAGDPFSLSVKLPYTGEVALDLPYAKPTGYGLGKSGWVTLTPAEEEMPPLQQILDWIDESYRAQAPKRLVKELDARP